MLLTSQDNRKFSKMGLNEKMGFNSGALLSLNGRPHPPRPPKIYFGGLRAFRSPNVRKYILPRFRDEKGRFLAQKIVLSHINTLWGHGRREIPRNRSGRSEGMRSPIRKPFVMTSGQEKYNFELDLIFFVRRHFSISAAESGVVGDHSDHRRQSPTFPAQAKLE